MPTNTLLNCQLCGDFSGERTTCAPCISQLLRFAVEPEWSVSDPFVDLEPVAGYGSSSPLGADRYGHYEILTRSDGSPWEIGRGTMGVTYKAFDTGLRCQVALKLINPQALVGRNADDRFLQEARIAAQLRHPHIASVFHLGSREGTWFYAMEFIEGETLWDIVQRQGPLSPQAAMNIAIQVSQALRVAHDNEYIHRDIKPSNIMLAASAHAMDKEGVFAKLIDFGLVKSLNETPFNAWTASAYFIGTPHFASPEQLEHGQGDERSDIYSLGATLFYVLTGKLPPPEEEVLKQLAATKISTPFARLVGEMLSRDQTSRPQNASSILERCAACLRDAQRSRGRGARRRGLQTLGLLAIALLTAIFLLGPVSLRLPERPSIKMPPTMPPSMNMDAYTAQVQAADHYAKLTEEDNSRAIELYRHAIELDPDYALAYAGIAQAFGQGVLRGWLPRERLVDALKSSQAAIRLRPDAVEGHYALAAVYAHQELPWKSLSQLHRALQINPSFEPAMRGFGWAWNALGYPEKALPWLKAAALRDPSNPKGWATIADAYKDLGADEEAIKNFEQARTLDPAGLGALYGLTHLEILNGRFDEAQELCARGLALRPEDMHGRTLAAQIAFYRSDFPQAELLYRALLKKNRSGDLVFYGSVRYLSALSYILSRTGRPEEGAALAAEAESLDRAAVAQGPQALFDLAALQAGRGQTSAAAHSFADAVDQGWLDYRSAYVDPRFEEARSDQLFQRTVLRVKETIAKKLSEAHQRCERQLLLADYPVQLPDPR